tara:strand:+ start:138 stop:1298 length:1161 start_codon:yes stop_codon:yes gene_type:complete
MKQVIVIFSLLLSILSNAQQFLEPDPINSKVLNEERPYLVYLPHSYNDSTYTRPKYPVVILLDGHYHHWYTLQTMEFLSRNQIIPECILVTIPNTNRTRDLTPTNSTIGYDGKVNNSYQSSGGGENFMQFITKELLPKIDSMYHTMDLRLFIGHSFGGLTTMQSFFSNSPSFDAYISMDPSTWWDDNLCVKQLDSINNFSETKAFFMTGANNNHLKEDTSSMRKTQIEINKLLQVKAKNVRSSYRIYDNDNHNSVTFISLYDGLRFIFESYRITMDVNASKEAFIKHFEQLSKEWEVEFKPNEFLINNAGYLLLDEGKQKNALDFFEWNVALFPNSWNAYDSLADYYYRTDQKKEALKNYKKSLQLNPKSENAINRIKELEGAMLK